MMSDPQINISIALAAYNEEIIIEDTLNKIIEELNTRQNVRWEIVCVNDGSSDHTGEIIDKLAESHTSAKVKAVHHRRNYGQGRALRTAFDFCEGDFIITLDADLSYSTENIYRMVDALHESDCDIVVASAYIKGGIVRNVPPLRRFLSKYGNSYLRRMMPQPIYTSTCVVRAYRREVIHTLLLNSDGMELQLEILNKALLMGFIIKEIPAKLEWKKSRSKNPNLQRTSKMRIRRSMRQYLLLGWLAQPATLFAILSLLLITPGAFMAFGLSRTMLPVILNNIGQTGFLQALSLGLEYIATSYTYSIIVSASLISLGVNIFMFSMILLQNQLYFEELNRSMHIMERRRISSIDYKKPGQANADINRPS